MNHASFQINIFIDSSALFTVIVQELCESQGGRPGLFVINEPSGFRGRKAILNYASALNVYMALNVHRNRKEGGNGVRRCALVSACP